MGWITLSLRKQTLKAQISELNTEAIQLSRKQRSVHRHLSYEESVFDAQKKNELRQAKATYMQMRNARPDVDSASYEAWKTAYAEAQEDYQAQKQDIEDYYDEIKEEIEADSQDEEDAIEEEITRTETQRDAMTAELQALTDQIKTEIQSTAIKF